MGTRNEAERQAGLVRLLLVILGMALAIIGWYRWAS